MRRLSVSLLAISFFILSLCSCTIEKRVTPIVHFSAYAVFSVGDMEVKTKVISSPDSSISMKVVSPQSIKGLSYHKVKDTLYIEFDDLKCTTKADYLTSYNPFEILSQALSSLNVSELEYIDTNDGCDIYDTKTPASEFTVFVDEKSGHITKIKPLVVECEVSFIENKII